MTCSEVAGVPHLTPRDASAALALITAATETRYEVVGFFAGPHGFAKRGHRPCVGDSDGLTPLTVSPRQRLDDVIKAVSDLPFGGTDCGLPMRYAQALEREVDTFVIYTDSETWAGLVHPARALRDYRLASGIDARLVVVGMVSNGFSIADPADPGMLDVIGFDTATAQLIADFDRGPSDARPGPAAKASGVVVDAGPGAGGRHPERRPRAPASAASGGVRHAFEQRTVMHGRRRTKLKKEPAAWRC
jgi:60 kDa SS-A/Ro ribonucleoprotein